MLNTHFDVSTVDYTCGHPVPDRADGARRGTRDSTRLESGNGMRDHSREQTNLSTIVCLSTAETNLRCTSMDHPWCMELETVAATHSAQHTAVPPTCSTSAATAAAPHAGRGERKNLAYRTPVVSMVCGGPVT